MSNRTYITSLPGLEDRLQTSARIATEQLSGCLQKNPLRRRNDALDRNTGIVNSILAGDKIGADERTINPGQHVIMKGIDLAEGGTHLAYFGNKAFRQGGKCDVALFQIDAFFPERQEKIAAGIGIDDRLQPEFGLMHLQGRDWALTGKSRNGAVAHSADKVPNDANIGIQRFGGRSTGAAVTL